ncbi:MAG: GTPase Era [Pseudomonadota bacterium]
MTDTDGQAEASAPTQPGGETQCALIAVIGAPNAGKSTLVNAMVGAKVSIVTHKVQTTRARVRGVALAGSAQLVFIDTPGIFKPKRRLDRSMVAAAWEGAEGVDMTLCMVDAPTYLAAEKGEASARKCRDDTDAILARLSNSDGEAILVLNKIDRIPRDRLLALLDTLSKAASFARVFLISALTGDGIADLKSFLAQTAPPGPWLYPPDQLSDITDRLMAAEVTREKLYLRLHDELPYDTTVETERWTRTAKKELRIDQIIYVARDTQKGIVVGKGGQTLKTIGELARKDLAELLDEPVHLFIHVKVRENWANEAARYREMGLDIVD